jgi:hypothetical protein
VSVDAGIEPWTVATLALAVRRRLKPLGWISSSYWGERKLPQKMAAFFTFVGHALTNQF